MEGISKSSAVSARVSLPGHSEGKWDWRQGSRAAGTCALGRDQWQESGQSHPCSWSGNCTLIIRLFQITRALLRWLWYEKWTLSQDPSARGASHVVISDQPTPFISGENTPRVVVTPWSQLLLWSRAAQKSNKRELEESRVRQIGKRGFAPQQAESLAPHFEAPGSLKIKI